MVGPPVAGPIGRSAGASQHDAAASGLGVQYRPDGGVAVEVVGEALEHGEVGAADQLAVVGRDAVERAVAQPDGAVGIVVGFVAAVGQRLAECRKDLVGVAIGRSMPGRLGAELGAQGTAARLSAAWAAPEGSASTAPASSSARAA
jgi:hypothetical protein